MTVQKSEVTPTDLKWDFRWYADHRILVEGRIDSVVRVRIFEQTGHARIHRYDKDFRHIQGGIVPSVKDAMEMFNA